MPVSTFLVWATLGASAAAPFSGQVTAGDKPWQIADGIAYQTELDPQVTTVVVLTQAGLDRDGFARDGLIDSDDIQGHFMATRSNGLELTIPAKGKTYSVAFWKDSGSSGTQVGAQELKITVHTAQRVAGSLNINYQGNSAKITFDLPVTTKVKSTSKPLPVDAGEPGKALAAYLDAHSRRDDAAMSALTHPDQARLLAGDGAVAQENLGIGRIQKDFSCRQFAKFDGGSQFHEEALVEFVCNGATRPRKETIVGTAVLRQSSGTWRFVGVGSQRIFEEDTSK
jgi:hypothetical protein